MLLRSALSRACPEAAASHDHNNNNSLSRRSFLRQTAVAGAAGILLNPLSQALAADGSKRERVLSLQAPATGEMIRMVYWTPTEGYIDDSLQEISHVMRDRRSGDVKRIDERLFDVIYILQTKLRPRQPIQILSGYRSPQTNEMLRRQNKNVARDSLHMRGMAADIRMSDRDLNQVHEVALSLQAGGVGRYRRSGFIHLDTGAVRRWG